MRSEASIVSDLSVLAVGVVFVAGLVARSTLTTARGNRYAPSRLPARVGESLRATGRCLPTTARQCPSP